MSNPDRTASGATDPDDGVPGRPSHHLRPGERHDAITELVLSAGTMRIEELAERFGVSTMTVHRDLDILEARGILRKSRGAVTAVATSLFESSPEYRDRENRSDKEALAQAAFNKISAITPDLTALPMLGPTGFCMALNKGTKIISTKGTTNIRA